MAIFIHEDMKIDMSISSKTILYKGGMLVFIGDGYKAISMMLNNSKNQEPVREKFHNQLTMREKPKFGGDDIETLRKIAIDEHTRNQEKKNKLKKRN